MLQDVISYLNGRLTGDTGIRALVRNKTVDAGVSTNFWTCTENSQNNAWNVNFSSGNTNNNNKYNTNYCRPLAALEENDIIEWIEAFEDCCRHKKSSNQCTLYRLKVVDLISLADEVLTFSYTPTTSITFIVTIPKLREIFAANFRDRIVQHWIVIRIEPLLEMRFVSHGNISYNCRKNFGTLAAVSRLRSMIEEVSDIYRRPAYIGRYDIKSFFMSIDVNILWTQLEPFIRKYYKGADMERLLYLLEVTIFHRPQDNCIRKGNLSLWKYLDHSKSLFHAKPNIGMPIGNITSQLLANFFLSFLDEHMQRLSALHGARYIRFVDDFTIVHTDKRIIRQMASFASDYLRDSLNLSLHPNKVYMQEVRHGVKFVGTVIKPGRDYLSNRTWGKFQFNLHSLEKLCDEILTSGTTYERLYRLDDAVSGINSYLGFACHNSSYSILFRSFGSLRSFWKICYATTHFRTIKIRKNYKLQNYLYGTYLQSRASSPQGGRARRKSGNKYHSDKLRHPGGEGIGEGSVLLSSGGDVPVTDELRGHRIRHSEKQV